jgi:outer membrane protein
MKRVAALSALALAVIAVHGFAQGESGNIKIAIVDMQRVIIESTPGKAVQARVEGFVNKKTAELQQEQQSLKRQEADLENQKSVLSQEAYASRHNDLEQKALAFRQKSEAADREYQQMYQQEMRQFIEMAAPIIEAIGKEGNYTMIVDRNDQGLLFYDQALDITDQVLARINAAQGTQGN